MTDLIQLAKECGATESARNSGGFHAESFETVRQFNRDQLAAFADRIRQDERNQCAKVAEGFIDSEWPSDDQSVQAENIASAIRSRKP